MIKPHSNYGQLKKILTEFQKWQTHRKCGWIQGSTLGTLSLQLFLSFYAKSVTSQASTTQVMGTKSAHFKC